MERYKRIFFVGMILISLGVVFNTSLMEDGTIGTVFIALGGILFIVAMKKKKQIEEEKTKKD